MSSKLPVENHLKTGGEQLEAIGKAEVTNRVSPECEAEFNALKIRRKHRYIIFRLGDEEIEVEKLGARTEGYDDFKRSFPFTDCRFGIFDQDYTSADGRPVSKLWFVSWLPTNGTTHNKMAYTSAKGKFRETILGAFDTQVASLQELDVNLGYAKDDEDDDNFEF